LRTRSFWELPPSRRPLQLGAGCGALHLSLKKPGLSLGELPFGCPAAEEVARAMADYNCGAIRR